MREDNCQIGRYYKILLRCTSCQYCGHVACLSFLKTNKKHLRKQIITILGKSVPTLI